MSESQAGKESHQQRQVAESYGIDAERYDRTRPHYPDDLVTRIVAASPGVEFLDVGIGTGIEARQFQAVGCKVLGVEPDARMAEFARGLGTDVEVATFESWDPAGRSFDGVIAAQAWHWVDAGVGASKAASVLRPGGRLAVFWNVAQPAPEVRDAFAAVYTKAVPEALATRAYTAKASDLQGSILFTKATEGIQRAGAFGEPEQWHFQWDHVYGKDEWLDQLPTQGDHSQFPPGKLDEVLDGIAAAVDAMGGTFTMHYTAVVVTAALAAAS